MASSHQIDRAFQDLGGLYAAEHSEHDDEGARQVQRIIRLLRKFKAHEQAEHAPPFGTPAFREATYQLADGRSVYYDDGRDSLRDAADLYAVLPELTSPVGSPNLENLQARHILDRMQTGEGLGETHIATLRGLLAKHAPKIAALRRSKDRHGQDLLATGSAGSDARITSPKGS